MTGSSKALTVGACMGVLMVATSGAGASVLYSNGGSGMGSGHDLANSIQADDFVLGLESVLTGATFSIFETSANAWDGTVKYYLYSDAGGTPGALVGSGVGMVVNVQPLGTNGLGFIFSEVRVSFENDVVLADGTYWFGLNLTDTIGDGDGVNWAGNDIGQQGSRSKRSFMGVNPWQNNFFDFAFSIEGTAVPSPGALAVFGLAGMGLARRRRR